MIVLIAGDVTESSVDVVVTLSLWVHLCTSVNLFLSLVHCYFSVSVILIITSVLLLLNS